MAGGAGGAGLSGVSLGGDAGEAGDGEGRVGEPVASVGGEFVVGEDVELELEFRFEFVLPLLDEAARSDDEASFEIATGDQLLHQQPGHDRLARAGAALNDVGSPMHKAAAKNGVKAGYAALYAKKLFCHGYR